MFEVRLLAHEGLRFFAEDEHLVVVDPTWIMATSPVATSGVEIEEAQVSYDGDFALLGWRDLDKSGLAPVLT